MGMATPLCDYCDKPLGDEPRVVTGSNRAVHERCANVDSRDCECERWRDGAVVCPVHPESTKPADWGMTPERALRKAKKKIGRLLEAIGERDHVINKHVSEVVDLKGQVRDLSRQVEEMQAHWRPVPIVHEWQPRDPQCIYCDEPREAVRHQRTSWAEEYPDTQPPPEQADESEAP